MDAVHGCGGVYKNHRRPQVTKDRRLMKKIKMTAGCQQRVAVPRSLYHTCTDGGIGLVFLVKERHAAHREVPALQTSLSFGKI